MCSFPDSVAQLVEQLTLNQWVESSSLSGVTLKLDILPDRIMAVHQILTLSVQVRVLVG